jgi:hypothetical protein
MTRASCSLENIGRRHRIGGKLRPASRTAALIKQLRAPAHLALSGRTMEFDGSGKCVAGC